MPEPHHPFPRTSFIGACALILTLLAISYEASGAATDETDQILEALALEPGMRVADVGAGKGRFSAILAQEVGAEGHVYATEIDQDDLDDIRQSLEDKGLDNFSVILGTTEDTGLDDGCCDAILLRLVYHHFTDPAPMRASLHRALRPGGRIVVIDIKPQEDWRELPGVPDRGGHGIQPADLISEMTCDGFKEVERYDDWGEEEEDHYCVVFRAVPRTTSSACSR